MKWLIVPLPAGKPWTGTTVFTDALGGSESAVAYLGFALQKLGEQVTVLSHGSNNWAGESICGVTYKPTQTIQTPEIYNDDWDVILVSRWINLLTDIPFKCQLRLFWSHDLPNPGTQDLRASGAVFLSQYHATYWHVDVTNPRIRIIGDGVDDSIFTPRGGERSDRKLIWTSNPDRGLPLAAKIFQELRLRWPELELHVYGRSKVYGWDDSVERPFLPGREYMENVFIHEPLPRATLARELENAWAMFYPTYWPETYCMATLEAQAMGTPVIASPYGALNETVKGGILTYDYLNAVSQLRNKGRWAKLSAAGIEFAAENTWKKVAERWIELARSIHDEPKS